MLGSPAEVNLASGHSAAHIPSIIAVPLTAAIRSPIPKMSAMPMPSRPSMNSQSAQAAPASVEGALQGADGHPAQERPQELDTDHHADDGEELGGALGDDPPERRVGPAGEFGCRLRAVQLRDFPAGHDGLLCLMP